MLRLLSALFITFICACSILPVFAWNALGHMVVASIAYQKLDPDVREEVEKLVKSFRLHYPKLQTYVEIAPWPDLICSQKIESFAH